MIIERLISTARQIKKLMLDDTVHTIKIYPDGSDVPRIFHLERRGRWIENDNGDTVCSNCGKLEIEFVYGTENWYGVGESNYCPNCGARMEVDE